MKFKKTILDERGKKYIKEKFKLADFNEKLFRRINFTQGSVYTYLPEEISKDSLYKFESGGKIPIDESKIIIRDGVKYIPIPVDERNYLAKELKGNLKNSDDVCILRCGWFERSDELVKRWKLKTPLHYFGKYSYNFLFPDFDVEKIEYSVSEVSDLVFNIGMITKTNSRMKFLSRDESDISHEEMDFFIKNARMIFSSAYDNEGHIIWKF